ncbi:MAG: glycosyltransferase [Lachnospiraceae bacterium]|nr:glycosyltransferase [Lachnospiraceae bacterium]
MLSNLRKAYAYMQRNGIEKTIYASLERMTVGYGDYEYIPPKVEVLEAQKERTFGKKTLFSIVVPAYETGEDYMKALVESLLAQTYPTWELIIADASSSDRVNDVINEYEDDRIKYYRLSENKGIAGNTNAAISKAAGDYIGLLDHDDLLTPDCLYEFALKIDAASNKGEEYAFIYSDEDKCDSSGHKFYEPNIKPEFNLDLLLSNNYICHFVCYRADIIRYLQLRDEYNGAQDHDLLLRAYRYTNERVILSDLQYGHIAKVLYHWRCHEDSTASNPLSKTYAYKAGIDCVADYLKTVSIDADVLETDHNGFFRVEYLDKLQYPEGSKALSDRERLTADTRGRLAYNILLNRYDIGCIGGHVFNGNKITGGIIDETHTCPYDGMNRHFSGYLHRAVLQQQATAVDIRNMMVAESLVSTFIDFAQDEKYNSLFNQDLINILKLRLMSGKLDAPYLDIVPYLTLKETEDVVYWNASVELCSRIVLEGYHIYFDPEFV